jgi:hypothetical protein
MPPSAIPHFKTESDIIEYGKGMQESKRLENETYLRSAKCRLLLFTQAGYRHAVHKYLAFVWR